jgi:5-formyltetrahydrofolate cyclo-ligase
MNALPPETKSELRSRIRAALKQISAEEAVTASRQACELLQAQTIWRQANCVLFYSPLALELDLSPLMREARVKGKTVALPRFIATDGCYGVFDAGHSPESLQRGNFGVLEPGPEAVAIPLNQLDLALVPGIAFDMGGRRLGRGKGFYDRLLAAVPSPKCGVAFDQQVVSEIPVESHDILMNFILTPTRWLVV